MAAAGKELTPSEYIEHHLTFFSKPVGAEDGGFWMINVDSLITALILGVVALGFIWWVVRGATAGVPDRRQAFIELLIGFIDDQVKGIFHHGDRNRFVAPAALTVFVWVVLMNAMDFPRLATLPRGARVVRPARVAPGADRRCEHHLCSCAVGLGADDRLLYRRQGAGRLDSRVVLRALRFQPTALAGEFSFQPGRVHLKAAIAFAAAVRQHVRGRDPIPAAVDVGGDRTRRHYLRFAARPGLGDLPHPYRAAAGLHLHDADRRLHLDGA